MNEKQSRVRYIRVLEKFFTKTVSLLKLEDFDEKLFKERTLKNYENVQKFKINTLSSNYLTSLTNFVNKTLSYIKNHSESLEEERAILLKEANLLQKKRKKNTYKKDKHKKLKFNDGY